MYKIIIIIIGKTQLEQVNLGQLCKIYKKLKVKDKDTK